MDTERDENRQTEQDDEGVELVPLYKDKNFVRAVIFIGIAMLLIVFLNYIRV